MKDPQLRVYAVWVPILPSDFELSVPRATGRLPDGRVSHFWDGGRELVKGFSPVLKMDEGSLVWDVYFVFDRDAEWKGELPVPDYWMHQLDLAPERNFDGDKLAEEINLLLRGPHSKLRT